MNHRDEAASANRTDGDQDMLPFAQKPTPCHCTEGPDAPAKLLEGQKGNAHVLVCL